MTSSATIIIDELRDAFPAKRAFQSFPLVDSVLGDEPFRVQAEFADKDDWTKLQPEWLDAAPGGLGSALSFLTDEAVRFYIPAYLAADLIGCLHRVNPPFWLVHGFDSMSRDVRVGGRAGKNKSWTDVACALWNGLTQKQAAAIVHYLEWRVARDGIAIADDIVEALATYWYARAARRMG